MAMGNQWTSPFLMGNEHFNGKSRFLSGDTEIHLEIVVLPLSC